MRFKQVLIELVALISLGSIGIVASSKTNIVQAKHIAAVYPKRMRGTWYNYDKYDKKVQKVIYTKNKSITYYEGRKYISHLHHKPKSTPKNSKRAASWCYIGARAKVRGRNWISIYGWEQTAGAGAHYNVSKLAGHWVLTSASGAGFWSSEHWYRSAKLAKKLRNKRYAHFAYEN